MLITAGQAKKIDREAREVLGIPVRVLMETAGAAVADEVERISRAGAITIVCGKGNNGGDGLVCARHLACRGRRTRVFLVADLDSLGRENADNLKALLKLGVDTVSISDAGVMPAFISALKSSAVVVDALLGTGISGTVTGMHKTVIGAINAAGRPVVAVDIPSGLDADNGVIRGCCVKARATVTFMAKKRGMSRGRGPGVCGRVTVKNLGIPLALAAMSARNPL